MKKIYIAILSTICFAQRTQSMELEKPSSDDHGYTIIYKDMSEMPKPIPISRDYNALSEELYRKGITDAEIRNLVNKGAVVNYKRKGCDWPLVFNMLMITA